MDMDPDIANWLLEFLLRQPLEDQTAKSVLDALPAPSDDDPKLKKIILLKELESDLSLNSVSTTTLELLELLEEAEFLLGNETVSNAMKQAYCAAAVECTVEILKSEGEGKRFKFFEAVRVLWKGKIAKMGKNVEKGGLGSEALWEWKDEIEAALWDDVVSERILKKSEEVNGVETVNAYIREERERMGPSFIEVVAERLGSDELLQGILGVTGKAAPPSGAGGSRNAGNGINKGKFNIREKHLGLRCSRGLASGNSRGTKIVDPDETTNVPSPKKYKLPSSPEVRKARESLETSSLNLQAVVKDPLPDALNIAQAIASEARNNEPQQPAEEARNNEPKQPEPAEDNHASAAGVAQAPVGNTSNAPKPSLMERNSTARSFEWDESIDGSHEDRAFRGKSRLPSPSRINTSPLKLYQMLDLKKRRTPRKWSLQEEDTLRTEVDKHGKGQWKLILSLNRDTFEGRTEVDLKDKWRNMSRY
ncbi:hypothetical protein ACS0TY_016012 [Phlomoides rotata]